VAAVYVLAFVAVLRQFRPLLGEHGLLPVPRFTAHVPWRASPSLFFWRYSDRLVLVVGWVGVLVAATLVVGLPQQGPPWVPLVAFGVLWVLYLSVVNVGQTFYGFGWESLLLEAGFLVAFLGSDRVAPPWTVLALLWWLVFRLEFGAGLIKWRGDPAWRDLTALYYHHETQRMNASFNVWHLVNAYGAFGSITRRRTEVVVEGTHDADPGPGSTWREYEFRGKPGDVRRLPRQYAPYHLRLDWLMWFLALGSSAQLQWFVPFLGRLLEADRPTLRLLAHDPFDGQRPRWVRARLYRYRFATPEERRSTGARWVRHDEGLMIDAVSLAMLSRAG
jgi:hypothetical protein